MDNRTIVFNDCILNKMTLKCWYEPKVDCVRRTCCSCCIDVASSPTFATTTSRDQTRWMGKIAYTYHLALRKENLNDGSRGEIDRGKTKKTLVPFSTMTFLPSTAWKKELRLLSMWQLRLTNVVLSFCNHVLSSFVTFPHCIPYDLATSVCPSTKREEEEENVMLRC